MRLIPKTIAAVAWPQQQLLKLIVVRVLYIMSMVLVISCSVLKKSESSDFSVYRLNHKYMFEVIEKSSEDVVLIHDTLQLTIDSKNMAARFLGLKMATWSLTSNPSELVQRGFADSDEYCEMQIPYQFNDWDKLLIAPYPRIFYPIYIGGTSEGAHKFNYSNTIVEGKTINQFTKCIRRDTIRSKFDKYIPCILYEGRNTSMIEYFGENEIKYWFSEKYGFVQIHYTTPQSFVEINRVF